MTAPLAGIVTPFAGGVRVAIRAKPGTPKQRPLKIVDIGDGKRALEVSVAAPAQDGKANKALIERLSDEWNLPRAALSIKAGDTGRIKILEITGAPEALLRKIAAILAL